MTRQTVHTIESTVSARRCAARVLTARRVLSLRRVLAVAVVAAFATLVCAPAALAAGAALIEPADGHHVDHLERAPMVQFDPASGETPKWVLLASDRAMTTTVRYCRQFVWATSAGAYHWGCNRWATGVDAAGGDRLLALEPGRVYHWQVVSTAADGKTEARSDVRSFAIDAEPAQQTPGEVSEQVHGTAFDDGTQLNLGVAAFVNSAVRVRTVSSARVAPFAFRIRVGHVGAIDVRRSYVKLTSAAGVRYLPLARAGSATAAGTLWKLTPAERALRTRRFTYQVFLRSTRNGALVRSPLRVVLVRSATGTGSTTTVRPPLG